MIFGNILPNNLVECFYCWIFYFSEVPSMTRILKNLYWGYIITVKSFFGIFYIAGLTYF